ncbi:DMT family transporter [Sulfitobacter guttiformis]|uniref:Threonine/homoserine efflux transporter RhtA n=1 Tax=Sulfitobacter guttiformis TaxID=74349 RepID=A0A420DQD5_9RHOB|nr:DMT family transporter [Sulfitobacter guttiformis]KIN73697.1 Permease, DMT superfamily [Sulfitobacter guttiformis KCTC 32187]RKE96337.1 threonine/homoserine efflux transporter RhtA [Sulfitobacter guttiformis]
MRLILLTLITMCAFAANSLLTRAAVEGGHIGPGAFAVLRVAAGAMTLGSIALLRGATLPLLRRVRIVGAVSLTAYMVGFSMAYMTLDAGLGALILFGVTQITMFGHAAITGQVPTARQVTGACVAFCGLVLVLWPGEESVTDPAGAALMCLAGLGWAAYTIAGRTAADPLATTGANFILCLPLIAVLLYKSGLEADQTGMFLAVVCGAVTSGLGYALWYSVLRQMQGATAAVVQLSVPVIAIIAGAVMLGEVVTPIVMIAAALVVGGIGWSVTAKR